MNRYARTLVVAGAAIAAAVSSASAANVSFSDDFSAWTETNSGFGDWLATSNATALEWNLTVNAGGALRTNSFTYTGAEVITSVTFDWRLANDNFDDRLTFKLLDTEGNVLLDMGAATAHGGGAIKPVFTSTVPVTTGTTGLVFVYQQTGSDTIYGKPAFFDSSNIDDFDALVDNVTITAVPEPSSALLLAGGLTMLARRRRS